MFCLVSLPLFAFEWPVSPLRLSASFGEYRNESFLKGVELESTGGKVKPIEKGTLIFTTGQRPAYNGGLAGGIGNTAVVEHERGIRSVYGYLSEIPSIRDRRLTLDSVLSSVGDSGATPGDVLYLQILDSEFGQTVNPLVSLPAPEDTRKPVIEKVELLPADEDKEGKKVGGINLERRRTVQEGEYMCSVRAYDLAAENEHVRRMTPISFRVFVNGEEKLVKQFEAIYVKTGVHVLVDGEGMNAKRLYRDNWEYRIGTVRLSPGDAQVEVVIRDYADLEAVKTFNLQVR